MQLYIYMYIYNYYYYQKFHSWVCTLHKWVLCPSKGMHKNVHSLFITASNWKQLKCLLRVERINRLWFIHTKEYYTEIKKNELLICNDMDECQNMMLNEVRYRRVNTFIWNSKRRKTNLWWQMSEKGLPLVGGIIRKWWWKCYVFYLDSGYFIHTRTFFRCVLKICVLYTSYSSKWLINIFKWSLHSRSPKFKLSSVTHSQRPQIFVLHFPSWGTWKHTCSLCKWE